MNYMRPFFLFLLFFLDAFPCKTRIAAGILRIPQKQESSYPSLQEVLRPTRPLAPRPLHEQAYRGRGGIAVVGERTAVMAVTLSKSEAIARAQIVGQKSVQQVIQELTQVKSNATVNELLSVLQLTVQQAKTIKLTEAQIAYFKTFTIAQWQEYLKNALGLVPYGTVGWDTIFELYAFYQFPLFRQHLQTIPEYTRSMAHLYEKLDPRSTKYDKDLADRIADTQEGLELYESIRNNAFVNQKIEEEAKKETQKFEKLPSEEQYALIETKKAERAKISVGYAQRNSKANVSPQNEQEELKKRLSNLKDELLLKVKEREIALATAQADQAKAKFEKEVREKEFAELQDIERALKTNVDQAKNEYQKVQEKYDAARAQIKNHNDKTTHQEQELRKIVLEELLPIQNKRTELIEKLEQVQARIYIQKFADKLINQERVRALNNEKIQNTAKLTPKAQEMFKKAGYDFVQYQEGIQSKLGNQMRVEGITLLNRVAELDNSTSLSNSILQATTNLAHIMLESTYTHDVSLVWATSDLANAALDLTLTTHEAATLSFQHTMSPVEQGVRQALERLKHPQMMIQDTLRSAVLIASILGSAHTGEDIRSSAHSLQEKVHNQEELCKAFDVITQAVKDMSADDIIRELTAAGVEGVAIGSFAKAAKAFTCIAHERFLATVRLPERAQARIVNSVRSIETAGEFASAHDKAGKVGVLGQAIDVESAVIKQKTASVFQEVEGAVWDMPEQGKMINGRFYSKHALERMAPDTPEIRAKLQERALARGIIPKNRKEFKKYVEPRSIPPSVVEDAIKNGKCTQGNSTWTWQYETDSVVVIINEFGDVITVI